MTHQAVEPLRPNQNSSAVTQRVPVSDGTPAPAAAIVLTHPTKKIKLHPMFAVLDAHPSDQPVVDVRLVPVMVVDFFARSTT